MSRTVSFGTPYAVHCLRRPAVAFSLRRGKPTMINLARPSGTSMPMRLAMRVADTECVVRATPVWPIAELLDLDGQFEPGLDAAATGLDADVIADHLESRMIAPPRQRRRGPRAVSSRAVFYASTED